MNTFTARCFTLGILTSFAFILSPVQAQQHKKLLEGQDYESHTFLVKLKPKTDQAGRRVSVFAPGFQKKLRSIQGKMTKVFPQMLSSLSQTQRTHRKGLPRTPDLSLLYRVDFKTNVPVTEAIRRLKDQDLIAYAEPSYLHHPQAITPNDPLFNDQKSYLAKIKAELAWDITKGSPDVIIAVTDTGLDMDHPDLVNNIYKNTDEVAENGVDDDNDGYIDNYIGWDFIGSSLANPTPDNNPDIGSSGQDHGTHVTGIIGASIDNNLGIAGIAPNCKLLILKIGDDSGVNKVARGYEAIVYAADQGAHIINASWGGTTNLQSKVEQEAITYATSKGALVITSAGNTNSNLLYEAPSAYQFVMSVASVSTQDAKSGFSNYGKNTDISAPGENIMSTTAKGTYNVRQGTSMASAVVAGAAALVKSRYPKLSGLQVAELLRVTSDNIQGLNPAFSNDLGNGRLNILRALTEAPPPSIRLTKILKLDHQGDMLNISSTFTNLLAGTSTPVKITVTGNNAYFETTQASLTTPQKLDSLDNFSNSGSPLQLKFKPNAPRHWITTLSFTYEAGSYKATEYVTVKLRSNDYLTIEKNQLKITLSNYGRLGNDENLDYLQGEGLVYKGKRLLFSSGLMIGKNDSKLVDAVQSDELPLKFHDHFVPTQKITEIENPKVADFEYEGIVSDGNAGNNQLGLAIKTHYYLWKSPPNDKFIVLEHTITNTSNETHQNLHAGWFADWDINPSKGGNNLNQARWDEVNQMGYVASTEAQNLEFAGVMLLKSDSEANYYALVNQNIAGSENILSDGFTNAEKFKTLSSGTSNNVAPATGAADVSHVVSTGPFTLNPHQSITVAFAFLVGDNLEDLKTQAQTVQKLFTGISNVKPPSQFKNQLNINPNPNNGVFQIKTGGAQIKNISVFNLQGKTVKQRFLVNDSKLNLKLSELGKGVYIVRIYTSDGFFTKRMVIK